jgi:hypothetical protein
MTDPAVLDEPGPLRSPLSFEGSRSECPFTHVGAQRLVFDPGRKQGNHPIENPQLKTDKGEIQLKEMSAVIPPPSTVKLFPVAKRSCTTALAAISPTLSRFGRTWLMEKKGSYECNRRFATTVRSRSLFTCV